MGNSWFDELRHNFMSLHLSLHKAALPMSIHVRSAVLTKILKFSRGVRFSIKRVVCLYNFVSVISNFKNIKPSAVFRMIYKSIIILVKVSIKVTICRRSIRMRCIGIGCGVYIESFSGRRRCGWRRTLPTETPGLVASTTEKGRQKITTGMYHTYINKFNIPKNSRRLRNAISYT